MSVLRRLAQRLFTSRTTERPLEEGAINLSTLEPEKSFPDYLEKIFSKIKNLNLDQKYQIQGIIKTGATKYGITEEQYSDILYKVIGQKPIFFQELTTGLPEYRGGKIGQTDRIFTYAPQSEIDKILTPQTGNPFKVGDYGDLDEILKGLSTKDKKVFSGILRKKFNELYPGDRFDGIFRTEILPDVYKNPLKKAVSEYSLGDLVNAPEDGQLWSDFFKALGWVPGA